MQSGFCTCSEVSLTLLTPESQHTSNSKILWPFFFKKIFIYLAALGLSYDTEDLSFSMQCLQLLHENSQLQHVVSSPRPGIEPGPLHWKHRVIATRPPQTTREVPLWTFLLLQPRDWQTSSIKGQRVNILSRLVGPMVSVASPQLCRYTVKVTTVDM